MNVFVLNFLRDVLTSVNRRGTLFVEAQVIDGEAFKAKNSHPIDLSTSKSLVV